MPAQTEKTVFLCKDDWSKSLHVCWSGDKGFVKNQDRARPELTQPLLCLFFLLKSVIFQGNRVMPERR